MFEWLPYFRAHNMSNYNNETCEYDDNQMHLPDSFAYHSAMTPSITDMTRFDASEESFELARHMLAVWRKAARIMLTADYYPLTECKKYAMQFHNPDLQCGFFQILNNVKNTNNIYTLRLEKIDPDNYYLLVNSEDENKMILSGKQLVNGVDFTVNSHSAVLYFYERI